MKKILPCLLLLCCLGCRERRSDKAGEKMQQFVIDISGYARQQQPGFMIVPQNGPELAFAYLDPGDGIHPPYLDAIEAFGNEEVFYDGSLNVDQERLDMLRTLKAFKKVLVADYVTDDGKIPDVILRNTSEGFIPFTRRNNNYDYAQIPADIFDENSDNITTMADVRNYLYLISSEGFSSKGSMIDAIAATNYDLVLIDLFYEDDALTAMDTERLKSKANGGKRLVIAYMNVGAAENYRYYWQSDWKLHRPNWLKKEYDGYDDEIWVKFWKDEWRDIIFGNDGSYTKRIIDAGFDGAYLDNVEAYYFIYFD